MSLDSLDLHTSVRCVSHSCEIRSRDHSSLHSSRMMRGRFEELGGLLSGLTSLKTAGSGGRARSEENLFL